MAPNHLVYIGALGAFAPDSIWCCSGGASVTAVVWGIESMLIIRRWAWGRRILSRTCCVVALAAAMGLSADTRAELAAEAGTNTPAQRPVGSQRPVKLRSRGVGSAPQASERAVLRTASGTAAAIGQLGACCSDAGVCLFDTDEAACDLLDNNGLWSAGGSCDPAGGLPQPICAQALCGFDNGPALDDTGGPRSQFAPDTRSGWAAADDFVLQGQVGTPCRLTRAVTWRTHTGGVQPVIDYQGVIVTIYADANNDGPDGKPLDDGTHTALAPGGIVYSQAVSLNAIILTQELSSCLPDLWRVDIPIDVVLSQGTRYWLEIQVVLDAAAGEAFAVYSQNNNGRAASAIATPLSTASWVAAAGNDGVCAGTPTAGTRTNLAFRIDGAAFTSPANDDCADVLAVGDGVISFSTEQATTDGPDEPEVCEFFLVTQISSDVWFEYVASCSGETIVSLCESDYDTKLAVYPGCGRCPPDILPIACNEDFCGADGTRSQVTFPAAAGECFTIRAGGFQGAMGPGRMQIECVPPLGACCGGNTCLGTLSEPDCAFEGGKWFMGETCAEFGCPLAQDECVDAIPVFTGVAFSGSTNGATGFTSSSCGIVDTADAWHSWTADCTGPAIIGLCDSTLDTTLSVFDACDGNELFCNDDSCGSFSLQSRIDPQLVQQDPLLVTAGETYYIRVAGSKGDVGNYTLLVEPCAQACCLPDGRCSDRRPENCAAGVATPQGPGSRCLGDGNGNGRDDVCDGCLPATIDHGRVMPPCGTVDARQPAAPNGGPRQGIGSPGEPGSPREPIIVALDPPLTGAEICFSLRETMADPISGVNDIATVTDLGDGRYELDLRQAIARGAVTRILYLGDVESKIDYVSHPANIGSDAVIDGTEVSTLVACCILETCPAPFGGYSCDVDHSGSVGPGDLLRLIDLLNGADGFSIWNGTALPTSTGCP